MVAAPVRIADPPPVKPPQAEVLAVPPASSLTLASTLLTEQLRELPRSADDLQRDFGLAFYDRVALDPLISGMERILLTAALTQGVQFTIPVPRAHPQYAAAARQAALVRAAYTRLPVALESLLYELGTQARRHGHALAEAVWTTAKILPNYGPQRCYADLKPKPLGTYTFVQDAFANTPYITPMYGYGGGPGIGLGGGGPGVVVNGMLHGRPVYPWVWFPTLIWDYTARDPRGRSALRAIYGAWWKKRQTEPGLLAYLARFGQPSLDLEMAPNTPEQQQDSTGTLRPSTDLYLEMGQAYQAGGIQVRPAGSKSTLQEASGDGAAYIRAEELWNREIAVGLTGQSLATGEGQHRSGTDAATHQDILGLLVTFLKGWLADFVNRALTRPLIVANFGADAVALAPHADLGRISPEDLAKMVNAISQLAGPGNYWNPAIVPADVRAELDNRMGLPQSQTGAVGPDGTPTDPATPPPTAPPPSQGGAA